MRGENAVRRTYEFLQKRIRISVLEARPGLPDRLWTDCLRSGRVVLDLSACGRDGGSCHDKSLYISRLDSCGSARSDGTTALDGVLHLMGVRFCRMGGSAQHLAGADCHVRCADTSEITNGAHMTKFLHKWLIATVAGR